MLPRIERLRRCFTNICNRLRQPKRKFNIIKKKNVCKKALIKKEESAKQWMRLVLGSLVPSPSPTRI